MLESRAETGGMRSAADWKSALRDPLACGGQFCDDASYPSGPSRPYFIIGVCCQIISPQYASVPMKPVLLALVFSSFAAAAEFPALYNSDPGNLQPTPAKEALKMLKLPKGFKATLFAAEPDVQNPIGLSWDARGRMWVAENYTYAEAVETQSLADWIGAHVRTFEFLGGCPEVLVPDNLKSGVTKSCRYEPDIQSTYAEMAGHYGVAVVPARVRKPKDKAKVEAGVLLVERWILARLRHRVFCSLPELNRAIAELVGDLNRRPFKKLPGCRRSAFEAQDRAALQPLPATPYEFAQWKQVKVHVDYHVEVDGHYYSVPHTLVGRKLDVRYTATTVEAFHQGQRVACHPRIDIRGRHTTVECHMPPHHRYSKWSPQRLIGWAEKTGPATAQLITAILQSRRHVEQGYRTCLGILRLGERFGDARLEAACQRALSINALSYRSVESILAHGLDAQALAPLAPAPILQHDNLRGADYFH